MRRFITLVGQKSSNAAFSLLLISALGMGAALSLRAADNPSSEAHSVPAVDGGIGPCSVGFTAKNEAGSPVYDAKIRVHINYGVFHKLDLEVGTNTDGKARFTGLPNRVKQPLQFYGSKDDLEGSTTYDPAEGCRAERMIVLRKTPANPTQP